MLIRIVLLSIVASAVLAEPKRSKILFKHGRHRNGFLLDPPAWHTTKIKDSPHLQQRWFVQNLDHFGEDGRTFNQLYFVNDVFYKPGGPAFLFISGESDASNSYIDSDLWTPDILANAKRFGAICFLLEHRYYGQSRPMNDTSVANLKWFNSRQAVEDLGYFITQIGRQYSLRDDTKWITFGGSYAGALSAWARLQHPELIVGAIASSGPVQAQVDFREYMEVVHNSLATYSQQCVDNIANATQQITAIIESSSCCESLNTLFGLCDPLDTTNKNDVANFYSNLVNPFAYVVQYNKDNGGLFATIATIDTVCDILTDKNEPDNLRRYANVQQWFLGIYGQTCFNYKYSDYIAELQDTDYDSVDQSARLWTYQTCTEFGYYQGSDSPNQPFGNGFPLSFSLQQCVDIFGPEFTSDRIYRAVASTNDYYGGRDLEATHVVLPNGSIDPWHALGIIRTEDPLSPAIFINGSAHCADMLPPRAADVPELGEARKIITRNIALWLST